MTPSKYERVYIAGPMSGLPNFNFDAFDRAAEMLRARGVQVCNPAVHGREWLALHHGEEPNESQYLEILAECSERVRHCDKIYLLKGWQNSRGAKHELELALIRKMQIEVEE